jgi:hypothetical protein
MAKTETRGRWWITYLLAALVVHLLLIGLARTEQFGDSLLRHSNVRIVIGIVVSTIVAALVVSRRSATRSSRSEADARDLATGG